MRGKQLKLFNTSGEQQKKHRILISSEMICISAVIVVILLIVSYVLGIEKGKSLDPSKKYSMPSKTKQIAVKISQPEPAEDKVSDIPPVKAEKTGSGENQAKEKKPAAEERSEVKQGSNKVPFTIQVASFKDKESAEKEKAHLEEKGFSSEICRKGEYLVIFVGRFKEKKDARGQIEKLKERYTDCFVRRF